METEAAANQLSNGDNLLKKSNENCITMETKDVGKLSLPPSVRPVSPDLDTENGDDICPNFTSPDTVLPSSPESNCYDSLRKYYDVHSSNNGSPCTPKDVIFDPFAPGSDKFMLAPNCRKCLRESRSNASRYLNFNSSVKFAIDETFESDSETISEEERLLEIVYGDLLEVIISTQANLVLSETCSDEVLAKDPVADGFKTPTSVPLLNGVAETCPGAPMKPTRKFSDIDKGLCRKLEF